MQTEVDGEQRVDKMFGCKKEELTGRWLEKITY